jgi:tight adherence protein C
MTPGLLTVFFVFIVAAVSAAGYVFVLRPARPEAAQAQMPDALTIDQRDLPAAQAAVFDIFRLIGEATPGAEKQTVLRRTLVIAGYRWPSATAIFLGIKAASSLLFASAAAWATMLNRADMGAAALASVCGLGFGYLIPDRILERIASARLDRLRRGLPAALDLMVLAVESGQSLDAAILETARGLRISHPDLATEFTQLQLELRANATRIDALRNFADRSRDPELRKFANLLIDTDRFGTSLGPALRTHARYLRIRFRQGAQEKARKVGVKLIFPVFFLIFPSVILVTLGPAVILLMTQMKNLLGQ